MYYLSAFGSFDCMWVLSGQIRIEEHNAAKSSIMISYLINLRVYSILYLYPSWPFRQFKCSFHIFQSFVNSKIHTGHFYYLPKFLVWSPFSSMRPHFHAGGADCQDGVILSSCHAVMLPCCHAVMVTCSERGSESWEQEGPSRISGNVLSWSAPPNI